MPQRTVRTNCQVAGCHKEAKAPRGYCHGHYHRFRKYGSPTGQPPPRKRESLESRFWRRVDRRGPDECWEWTGGRNSYGYGTFRYIYATLFAARVSLELHGVEIPEGYLACHHCDNPGCVNPRHLYAGSRKDNGRDASVRGRIPQGERNAHAKITAEQVVSMRRAHAAGDRIKDIAERFSVSHSLVSSVVHRRTWRHIP